MTETEFTLIILSIVAVFTLSFVVTLMESSRNDRLDKEQQRWRKIRREMKK